MAWRHLSTNKYKREAYIETDGKIQPAPAPRFSRTAPAAGGIVKNGDSAKKTLQQWKSA